MNDNSDLCYGSSAESETVLEAVSLVFANGTTLNRVQSAARRVNLDISPAARRSLRQLCPVPNLPSGFPNPREDLKSRSPNLGPYTTKGTLREPPLRDLLSRSSRGSGFWVAP